MRKLIKRGVAFMVASTMILGMFTSVFAEEVQGTIETETATDNNSQEETEITVSGDDKPFLSLGADLKENEKAIVLDLLGVSADSLDQYDVITVSNAEEHEYLGSYIPSERIGNRALSSVLVMAGEKGSGIQVNTKNINYCTAGMYQNALATAGVTDAKVIVAGPFEISGTAALLGAIRAYSSMTGKEIDETVIDGAIQEIVVTGTLEDALGNDENVEGMVAFLKDQLAESENMSDDEITDAIEDAADKFDVSLTQDQINELLSLLKKLQSLDLDWTGIAKQAQSVYNKLQAMGFDISKIDINAIKENKSSIIDKIIAFIKKILDLLG